MMMSCGFLAEGVRSVLGDGSSFGIRLRYVEEPQPLGTGGALSSRSRSWPSAPSCSTVTFSPTWT